MPCDRLAAATQALRHRLADALDRVASGLWTLAHRLRPVYSGPLCPDCRLGPELPEDEECPICREQYAQQERDKELEHGGFERGFDQGYEARARGDAW